MQILGVTSLIRYNCFWSLIELIWSFKKWALLDNLVCALIRLLIQVVDVMRILFHLLVVFVNRNAEKAVA